MPWGLHTCTVVLTTKSGLLAKTRCCEAALTLLAEMAWKSHGEPCCTWMRSSARARPTVWSTDNPARSPPHWKAFEGPNLKYCR